MNERCVHDMLADQCTFCRPTSLPERPQSASWGPWIVARFDSDCDGLCGGVIDEGEHTRSDGEGGWLCELCGGYEG